MQLVHARSLISTVHTVPSTSALIEITGLAPKHKPRKRYFTDPELAANYAVSTNTEGYSVFVGVNPRKAMSGFEADVPYVHALPLDLQPERTSIQEVFDKLTACGVPPSITAWSGNGAHAYLLLDAPTEPHAAKLVSERLCKATGSDAIFNTNRILRIPGSVNWKQPPRWCYLTGLWPDRRYSLEQITKALDCMGAPAVVRRKEGIPVPTEPPLDWLDIRKRLSPGVLDIIDTGEKNAYSEAQVTRSEADWVVVCALVRAGVTDEMIAWIYETQPVGMLKYREVGAHYLNQTIHTARRATAAPAVERAAARSGPPVYRGGAIDSVRQRSYALRAGR